MLQFDNIADIDIDVVVAQVVSESWSEFTLKYEINKHVQVHCMSSVKVGVNYIR